MRLRLLMFILVGVFTMSVAHANTFVTMVTNKGTIKIELYDDKAPVTVKNFVSYVNAGFYDKTIFHRVIDGFMIQGGGMTLDFKEKSTNAPIKNEAANGLKNTRGTLAMARTAVPDSASSQFFINLVDNTPLDYVNDTARGIGYAVFGKVIGGMDVVDQIAKVKTTRNGMHADVPVNSVIIEKVTVDFQEKTK